VIEVEQRVIHLLGVTANPAGPPVIHGISDSFLVGSVRLDEHVAAIRAKATA
jgi:hypothetical protein